MISIPETDSRVCSRCLEQTGTPNFGQTCTAPNAKGGKHNLKRRTLWAGVVIDAPWDMTSQRQALRYFGECCWDECHYAIVRTFSPEETRALQTGKAKLELKVVWEREDAA